MARARSGAGALAAAGAELDRPVRNGQREGGADGAVDEPDLAALGAHQLGRNRKPKPAAAAACRALERLEQMRPGLFGYPRPGIRHLDYDHAAFAPTGQADLVAAGLVRGAAFERLDRVARQVEQHAKQLV